MDEIGQPHLSWLTLGPSWAKNGQGQPRELRGCQVAKTGVNFISFGALPGVYSVSVLGYHQIA